MNDSDSERGEPSWMPKKSSADNQSNPYAAPDSVTDAKSARSGLLPHQKAGRVVRLMAWLCVLGTAGIGAAILLPILSSGKNLDAEIVVTLAVTGAFSVTLFFVAAAIFRHATWGRVAGIAYGLILLVGFPVGTVIGCYILWQLIFGWNDGEYEVKLS